MTHRLAPEAEAELDDIWYYTARASDSIEIADRLIDSITNRFFMLARHPHIGRCRDEDLRPGLRSFPVGEYVIVYRIDGEDILILHVFRGTRNMQALLREQRAFGLRQHGGGETRIQAFRIASACSAVNRRSPRAACSTSSRLRRARITPRVECALEPSRR